MLYYGTDPEPDTTEYTLVFEDKRSIVTVRAKLRPKNKSWAFGNNLPRGEILGTQGSVNR